MKDYYYNHDCKYFLKESEDKIICKHEEQIPVNRDITYSNACKNCPLYPLKDYPHDIINRLKNVKPVQELIKDGVPEQEWLIDKVVLKGGITFFGGTAGSMKSWAALAASVCVASNKPFLEDFSVKEGVVLYLDEENGLTTMIRRFDGLLKGYCVEETANNIPLSSFQDVALDEEPHHFSNQLLDAMIKKYDPVMVIIDSMVRAMHGEEDKAKDVKKVFENLKQYLERGIGFIILHHTIKDYRNDLKSLRGSGDFSAFADVVMMFNVVKHNNRSVCKVVTTKNRHVAREDFVETAFYLDDEDGFFLEKVGVESVDYDVVRECSNDIWSFLQVEGIEEFKRAQIVTVMAKKAYNRSCVDRALRLLVVSEKVRKSEKYGFYKKIAEKVL